VTFSPVVVPAVVVSAVAVSAVAVALGAVSSTAVPSAAVITAEVPAVSWSAWVAVSVRSLIVGSVDSLLVVPC